jgi:2-octaprenyl-6-methoxyphenol hydroxylase
MNPARAPVLIVGGGPVGLTLALMLARRHVACEVLDARTLEAAQSDRRLLALSHGTLQLLRPLVRLPSAACAPIRSVHVSSAGEFGRVALDENDTGVSPLGVTIRYGDLLTPLATACARDERISMRRPCRVSQIRQRPGKAVAQLDDAVLEADIVVNAEGLAPLSPDAPEQFAVLADVIVQGVAEGSAFERFTREGPLALLPLTGAVDGGRPMGLVWCMSPDAAERRAALSDDEFLDELRRAFGVRDGRVVRIGPRLRVPLHEHARDVLREHRVVFLGNAAQTLHPVAGQGLNLGLRDCATLADRLGCAHVDGRDLESALDEYDRARRTDRAAILALTRSAPALFRTTAAPVAVGRSAALTALAMFPNLRRPFARLLMFGVRS